MPFALAPLSPTHLDQLALAIERARAQWVPGLTAPEQVVVALERVLLFLKQNGNPAPQSRQVASLAFLLGDALVKASTFSWHSVSEDGSVNPALVSADRSRALLVVDVVTLLVLGQGKGTLRELLTACAADGPHPLFTSLEEDGSP